MTKILTPEAFVHHIKGRLLEEGEIPHVVVACRQGEFVVVIIDPNCPSFELRQKAFGLAGASMFDAFPDGGPPELIMIAREIWMSKQDQVKASEDPQRREGLMVTIANFEANEHYALAYEITRPGNQIDLHLVQRLEAPQFEDHNLKALVGSMLQAYKGIAPDVDGLTVLEVSSRG